jgi:hypothetical protein
MGSTTKAVRNGRSVSLASVMHKVERVEQVGGSPRDVHSRSNTPTTEPDGEFTQCTERSVICRATGLILSDSSCSNCISPSCLVCNAMQCNAMKRNADCAKM